MLFCSIWFLWVLLLVSRSLSPEAAHNWLLPQMHTEWGIFSSLSINVQLMQTNDKENLEASFFIHIFNVWRQLDMNTEQEIRSTQAREESISDTVLYIWLFFAAICQRSRVFFFSVGTELTSTAVNFWNTHLKISSVSRSQRLYCFNPQTKVQEPKDFRFNEWEFYYSLMSWRGHYLYGDKVVKKASKGKSWNFLFKFIKLEVILQIVLAAWKVNHILG